MEEGLGPEEGRGESLPLEVLSGSLASPGPVTGLMNGVLPLQCLLVMLNSPSAPNQHVLSLSASGTVGGAVVLKDVENQGKVLWRAGWWKCRGWGRGAYRRARNAFSFSVFAVLESIFPFRSGVALENPITDVSSVGLFQI